MRHRVQVTESETRLMANQKIVGTAQTTDPFEFVSWYVKDPERGICRDIPIEYFVDEA